MTLREVTSASLYANKQKAVDLDTKIKIAGDKKGYEELVNIKAREDEELFCEELQQVNTDDRTVEVVEIYEDIAKLRGASDE